MFIIGIDPHKGSHTTVGHSYGANCAMGGAALTNNVHHLVLYEPSLGLTYPTDSIESIEDAVAAGDMEVAIVAVLTGILEMAEEEIDVFRSSPLWPLRVAAAPTVPRECRVEDGWVYENGQFDGITAPTLLLAGTDSLPALTEATRQAAAAIPNAEIRVLEGPAHFAHNTNPVMVSAIIRQFVSS